MTRAPKTIRGKRVTKSTLKRHAELKAKNDERKQLALDIEARAKEPVVAVINPSNLPRYTYEIKPKGVTPTYELKGNPTS